MSSVLAIDFGNENHVISAPRKGGIDIISQSSHRLIPSIIAFSDIRRYAGEHAFQQQSLNQKNTITNLKRLIGIKYDSDECKFIQNQVPFKLVKLDDGYIGIEVNYLKETVIHRVEQCLSYLLKNAFQIANSNEIHATDCVIVVPPWWNEVQRQTIIDSAKISGYNVLQLLNSTTAASIVYSMYHRKKLHQNSDEPVPVAFIDFGNSSFNVSIAMLKQGSVEVKSFASDKHLGGDDFTKILVKFLLEKTIQKYNIDPTKSSRAMLRFIQTAEKLKKNLSVNRAIPFDIQNLMNGVDVNFIVKRDELEEISKHLIDRIEEPIRKALQLAGVNKEDLFAIEVHGGASRMTAVKAKIREVFGKDISQSLNPDECFSMGGGFQAAILSSQYKVDLKVTDILQHQINIECDNENSKELFKKFTTLPNQIILPINVKRKNNVRFLNEKSEVIYTIEIETDTDEPVIVNLNVQLTNDGFITAEVEQKDGIHIKSKFERKFGLTSIQIEQYQNKEKEMSRRDEEEQEIDQARDNLRDYIFTMYTYVLCDFPGFDPSKKLEYLQKTLMAQEWFEENEFTRLPLQDYNDQLDALKSFGDPAIARKNAHIEIPNKLRELIKTAEIERNKLDNKDEKFDHILEDEREVVRKEIDDFSEWLKNEIDEIEKVPQYMDVPFKIDDAQKKFIDIENKVIGLFMKPKPTETGNERNEEE